MMVSDITRVTHSWLPGGVAATLLRLGSFPRSSSSNSTLLLQRMLSQTLSYPLTIRQTSPEDDLVVGCHKLRYDEW